MSPNARTGIEVSIPLRILLLTTPEDLMFAEGILKAKGEK